mmetsp:Transcript_38704/g.92622  ORF Transcript_38704/g.92622 Transcript_38704/m.92622 type:complete len:318 (+) Transcript_38704:373-1326(+)
MFKIRAVERDRRESNISEGRLINAKARLGQGEVFAEQPQSQGKDESFLNEGEIHKDQHAPRVVRDYRRRALPQEGRHVRQSHDVPVVVAVVGSKPELLPPSPARVVLHARRRHELERALEVLVPVLRRGDRVGGVPEGLRPEQTLLDRRTVPSDVGHCRVDHGPGRREGRRGGRVAGGAGVVLQRPPGGGAVGTGRTRVGGGDGRRRGECGGEDGDARHHDLLPDFLLPPSAFSLPDPLSPFPLGFRASSCPRRGFRARSFSAVKRAAPTMKILRPLSFRLSARGNQGLPSLLLFANLMFLLLAAQTAQSARLLLSP